MTQRRSDAATQASARMQAQASNNAGRRTRAPTKAKASSKQKEAVGAIGQRFSSVASGCVPSETEPGWGSVTVFSSREWSPFEIFFDGAGRCDSCSLVRVFFSTAASFCEIDQCLAQQECSTPLIGAGKQNGRMRFCQPGKTFFRIESVLQPALTPPLLHLAV